MLILKDLHPNKAHEGLTLTPIYVYAPWFTGDNRIILSALHLGDDILVQGMFSKDIQPVQKIVPTYIGFDYGVFTMSNITTITSQEVQELKANGCVTLGYEGCITEIELVN